MPTFTASELKRYEWGACLAGLSGLALAFATRLSYDKAGFWYDYIVALGRAGWMIVILSVIWLGLSALHRHTDFFSLDRSLAADKFALTLVFIVILSGATLAAVLHALPATDPKKLPSNQKRSEEILYSDRHFRAYVSAAVAVAGLALASFPCIRFFRR